MRACFPEESEIAINFHVHIGKVLEILGDIGAYIFLIDLGNDGNQDVQLDDYHDYSLYGPYEPYYIDDQVGLAPILQIDNVLLILDNLRKVIPYYRIWSFQLANGLLYGVEANSERIPQILEISGRNFYIGTFFV